MTNFDNQKIFADDYATPQISIGDLFADFGETANGTTVIKHKYFRIPFYQRGYAWGIRQYYELWEDIKGIRKNIMQKPDTLHHLDILTLKKNIDFDNDKVLCNDIVFDIADGQQRLITLTLLIRLLLKRLGDPQSDTSVFLGNDEFTRKLQYSTAALDPRKFLENCVFAFDKEASTENSIYYENIETAFRFFWDDDISYDNNYEVISPDKKQWKNTKGRQKKSIAICDVSIQEAREYLELIKTNFMVSINFINSAFDENIAFETID